MSIQNKLLIELSTGNILFEISSNNVLIENVVYIKNRYGDNRVLNLTKFLPSMEQGTETQQFTQFIEDFYNTMFDGESGLVSTVSDISVSGDYRLSAVSGIDGVRTVFMPYQYQHPNTLSAISADTNSIERVILSTGNSDRMSILEKINRLTELKDPELIDIEYIQYFASNLGYNVDVYRSEVGNVGEELGSRVVATSTTSADDVNEYLRFMVSNLPNWYKIKATDNAIKVMLYSFGLVGDLIDYYTENYLEDNRWTADYEGDLSNIPRTYFSTPHFAIRIMVDESEDLIADVAKRESVIRAIKSIQPINTVFRNLVGYADRDINMNMSMMTRLTRYMRITD